MPRSRLPLLFIFLAILFVYYPAITYDFAFSDDFPFYRDTRNTEATLKTLLMDARFVYPVWVLGIFAKATPLAGFKFVRILAVAGVLASAIMFYALLRRWLVRERIWAAAIAIAFAVNPGMLFLASWVCAGMWTWAAFVSLLSVYILLGPPEGNELHSSLGTLPSRGETMDWQATLRRAPLAALCLFLGLATYQPITMTFWVGVLIWVIGQFDGRKEAWRKLAVIVGTFGAVAVVYYVVSKLFVVGDSERFVIKVTPHRRLAWFLAYPLRVALGYPALQPPYVLSGIVAVFLGWGFIRHTKRLQRPVYIAILVAILLPLTMLPMMVASQRYDVSRARLPVYGSVVVLWSVALAAFASTRRSVQISRWLVVSGALIGAGFGQHHLLHYFIVPQVVEQSYVQTQLAEYIKKSPDLTRPIHILPPPKRQEFAGCFVNDEWGLASSSQFWATASMVRLLLASSLSRDISELQQVPVTYSMAGEEMPPPEGAFVIDLRELRLAY